MIRRLALVIVTVIATLATTALPAHADDEIGVSLDGTTWASQLALPLFAPDFAWVPGDVEQRTFRVRNDGPSVSEITIDLVASDPDGLLASDAFEFEARVGSGPWVAVTGGTASLATDLEIAEGARTTVTVRGTFAPETTDHMDEVAPFDVRVTMADAGDVGAAGSADTDGLPDTGSSVGLALIWLAAGLIGTGLAVAGLGRGEGEVRHG